jgi:hypothetical protein
MVVAILTMVIHGASRRHQKTELHLCEAKAKAKLDPNRTW